MGKNNLFFLLLLASLAFLLGLRAFRLDRVPSGLFVDETRVAAHASCIWEDGMDAHGRSFPHFPFGAAWGVHGPGPLYLQALWQGVFGTSITSIRMFSVVMSFVSIGLMFLIVERLTDKNIALMAVTFDVLSPGSFYMSRLAWEHFSSNVFLLLFLLAFLYARGTWAFLCSGVLAGAAFYTYASSQFAILVYIFLGLLLRYTIGSKVSLKSFLLFSVGAFIALLPLLSELLSGNLFSRFRKVGILSYVEEGGIYSLVDVIIHVFKSVSAHISYGFMVEGSGFSVVFGLGKYGPLLGVFYILFCVSIISFLVCCYHCTKHKNDIKNLKLTSLFLLGFLLSLMPSALSASDMTSLFRIAPSLPLLYVFLALSVFNLKSLCRERLGTVLVVSFFFVSCFQFFNFSRYYFTEHEIVTKGDFRKDQFDVMGSYQTKEAFLRGMEKGGYGFYAFFARREDSLFKMSCEELRAQSSKFEDRSIKSRLVKGT